MNMPDVESIVESVIRELKASGVGPGAGASAMRTLGKRGPDVRRSIPSGYQVTVLGAGHGGLAMAGHMQLAGCDVRIYSAFRRELAAVIEQGGVHVEGEEVSGFAKVRVCQSLDEAVAGANLIMIAAPATAHATFATLLAPLLEDGQIVCLNPGRTGGSLEFGAVLRRFGLSKRIILGETNTFIYAAEMRGPGRTEILHEKFTMRAAALPASDNAEFVGALNYMYPQIEAAENVLECGFNNVDPVQHLGPMMLNTAALERSARDEGNTYQFYQDQMTPTVAALVMEKIDQDKVSVGRAFGLSHILSTMDWQRQHYQVDGKDLFEVLRNNRYYDGFHVGKHIMGYNIVQDGVGNGCVPMSEFGRLLGLKTPMLDAMTNLACAMTGIDFWTFGRTLERMGLKGMNKDDILEYVTTQSYLGDCEASGVCRTLSTKR